MASLFLWACAEEKTDLVPEQKKDFCSSIHRNDSVNLSQTLATVKDLMETSTGVYVLEDGDAAMISRAWLSEYAEKTMDIQYFIFSTDNVGLIACDYIVRAADRGVKVRILVDDILVEAEPDEIMALDAHKNIEIKIYNPGINLGKNIVQKAGAWAKDFKKSNQRMHNKTFTIDGKVTITGGRNIADEYFDYDHEYNFRDRDVLLMGKICKQVRQSFEDFWNYEASIPVAQVLQMVSIQKEGKGNFERLHQYACNPENYWPQVREKVSTIPQAFKMLQDSGLIVWTDSILFVSDRPGKNNGSEGMKGGGISTDSLAHLVRRARSSVDIQSPYLIMDEKGIDLMKSVTARGVKVRILTNSLASTDNLEAFSGYQRCRKKLLEAGVKVYEMRPDAEKRYKIMTGALQKKMNYSPIFGLHAKSMVIDDGIAVVGTFNIDPRSANLNTECVTIIHSAKIANGIKQQMEEEFRPENAWETTTDWNPDAKAGVNKQVKAVSKRIFPKSIL